MTAATCLTIKHVEKDGHQSLTTATDLSFEPAGPKQQSPQLVAFGVPNPVSDGCNRYSSGIVYVMNGDGATVAKYDLG